MYGADGYTLETQVRSGCVETLRDERLQANKDAANRYQTEQERRNQTAVKRSAGYDFSAYTSAEKTLVDGVKSNRNSGYDR